MPDCACGKVSRTRGLCASCYNQEQYLKHRPKRLASSAAYRKAHPDKVAASKQSDTARAYTRQWQVDNPRAGRLDRIAFQAAKSRASSKGLDFTISLADIPLIPEHCPVLGMLLTKGDVLGKKGALPSSASLDRIDSTKGYVPGNIRWISHRANMLKSNATINEMRQVLADLEQTQGTKS